MGNRLEPPPHFLFFSQSRKGLNRNTTILLAPVASALCAPSTGPMETPTKPSLLAQSGCLQKQAATPAMQRAPAPSFCRSLLPSPSSSLLLPQHAPLEWTESWRWGTSCSYGPLKNILPAQFSSSIWSHPTLWIKNKSIENSLPPCSPFQCPNCFHIPHLIRSCHILAM